MWLPALVGITIVGIVINSPTWISFYERYYQELNDATSVDVLDVVRSAGTSSGNTIAETRTLRVVAIWWWILPAIGLPRWIGATIDAVLLILAAACVVAMLKRPVETAASGGT
jgi:hypothetical protein